MPLIRSTATKSRSDVKLGEVTRLVSAPEGAPEGIQNLWFRASRFPETDMGVETERAFIDWYDNQVALNEMADQIITQLHSVAPIRYENEVPIEFPAWFGKPWAERLHMRWSAGLADAIIEAKMWLVENVETVSAPPQSP